MRFNQSSENSNEWFATEICNGVEIEFCVDASYFIDNIIIWDHVDLITTQLLKDLDFIYEISKKWAIRLYNGYGNQLEEVDRFSKDGCEFQQLLFVRLVDPKLKYDDNYHCLRSNPKFLVDNIFDSEYTYIDSSCLFTIFKETHFVGVMANCVQL